MDLFSVLQSVRHSRQLLSVLSILHGELHPKSPLNQVSISKTNLCPVHAVPWRWSREQLPCILAQSPLRRCSCNCRRCCGCRGRSNVVMTLLYKTQKQRVCRHQGGYQQLISTKHSPESTALGSTSIKEAQKHFRVGFRRAKRKTQHLCRRGFGLV